MHDLDRGLSAELRHTVTSRDTADSWANELPVLATPVLLWLAEVTCMRAIDGRVADEDMTLGLSHDVTHLAPTPSGDVVLITATLEAIDGIKLVFRVEAHDSQDTILRGIHRRARVKRAPFIERVEHKRRAIDAAHSGTSPTEPHPHPVAQTA
jgi:predicted thioesterase